MKILFEINGDIEIKKGIHDLPEAFTYAKEQAKEHNCKVRFWEIKEEYAVVIEPPTPTKP